MQEPGSELALKREDAGTSGRGKDLKLWVWGQALEGAPPSGLNSFWKWEARSCAKSHAADGVVGKEREGAGRVLAAGSGTLPVPGQGGLACRNQLPQGRGQA